MFIVNCHDAFYARFMKSLSPSVIFISPRQYKIKNQRKPESDVSVTEA